MFLSELKYITNYKYVSREKILNLLSQLTTIYNSDNKEISKTEYTSFLNNIDSNTHIFVLHDEKQLIGMATMIIERKLTHGGSNVAHIEDVVIDKIFTGKGHGKKLMELLVERAKLLKCYKVILNSSPDKIKFYEKCGFQQKNVEMSLYL